MSSVQWGRAFASAARSRSFVERSSTSLSCVARQRILIRIVGKPHAHLSSVQWLLLRKTKGIYKEYSSFSQEMQMGIGKYCKRPLLIGLIVFTLIIVGCQKTPTEASFPNSDLYNFCLQNNGTILSSIPGQCNYQGLIYFQDTNNAINLQFCTLYYDGCNTCAVGNGTITGCTKIACPENAKTPKCLNYNEPIVQNNNIIPVNFKCNQGDIKVVFDNENHIANLTYGMATTELSQVVSGSGAKYSNQKITLFTKGDSVLVFDARNESIFIFENCSVK